MEYMETFARAPSAAGVKLVLGVMVEQNWKLRHLDVKQAFVQADLDYPVYTRLPEGCGEMSGEFLMNYSKRLICFSRLLTLRRCSSCFIFVLLISGGNFDSIADFSLPYFGRL